MITAALLVYALQEFVVRDAVQRELRMHAVGELIAAPSAPTSGQYYLQPHLTLERSQDDLRNRVLGAYLRLAILDPLARDERKFTSVQELEELATRFCQPPLDPSQERIQADEQGWLVCYLRPEQHDWLARFLALQSESERQWLAEVSTDWFSMSTGDVAALDMEGSALLLDGEDAVTRIRQQLERARADHLVAPRVTAFPGQHAELSTLSEVSYVKEYKLEIVEPGRQEIADPVVDVIQEGFVMNLRALQTGDALYGLRLDCSSSELERPIPTRRFKLSPAHPTEVEIGMPQLRTAQVEATVLVPDGGGVLLVTNGITEGRSIAILVQFRRAALAADRTDGAR
jgi:hypothetical protein